MLKTLLLSGLVSIRVGTAVRIIVSASLGEGEWVVAMNLAHARQRASCADGIIAQPKRLSWYRDSQILKHLLTSTVVAIQRWV